MDVDTASMDQHCGRSAAHPCIFKRSPMPSVVQCIIKETVKAKNSESSYRRHFLFLKDVVAPKSRVGVLTKEWVASGTGGEVRCYL